MLFRGAATLTRNNKAYRFQSRFYRSLQIALDHAHASRASRDRDFRSCLDRGRSRGQMRVADEKKNKAKEKKRDEREERRQAQKKGKDASL